MIFATFNGCALIHMFLMAPETKGKTLEEMDDVFNSGIPPWKQGVKGSKLDQVERDIEAGNLKVHRPAQTTTTEKVDVAPETTTEPKVAV